MAQIISGGIDTVDYLIYGERDYELNNELIERGRDDSKWLGDRAGRIYEAATKAFDSVYNSEALRLARAAARKVETMWQEDSIRELLTIGHLQNAPLSMIPYLMAEPTTRELYHRGRVEGYGELYEDFQPGIVGEDVIEYQEVMDGWAVKDPTDETGENYVMTTYFVDNEMDTHKQLQIQRSWEALSLAIALGKEDPTSRWNATLG